MRIKIFLLILVYAIGLLFFYEIIVIENYQKLTPYNLLFSTLILFANRSNTNLSFVKFFITVFLSGFVMEWLGVATELIFGSYQYGESLGIKIFHIPVIIGLNWVMVVYTSWVIANKVFGNIHAKAFFGGLLMVLLDILIEPFAMRYDLWHWKNDVVPIQNYISWFIFGWLLQYVFIKADVDKNNLVAKALYFIQLFFFAALLIR